MSTDLGRGAQVYGAQVAVAALHWEQGETGQAVDTRGMTVAPMGSPLGEVTVGSVVPVVSSLSR